MRVSASDGASVDIRLNGAHVTSWRPAPGDEERLFLSDRASVGEGMSIRGGIPVIFPQFAAEGPLPRHGFARTALWTLDETGVDTKGEAFAALSLTDSDATRALWPAAFHAILTVSVLGPRLTTSLSVENTGTAPFHFAAALHTYLRVLDIMDAEIVGLHGCRYRESRAPGVFRVDDHETVRVDGEIDRVYADAPARLTLREPSRRLTLESTNFPDVVIWNPGAGKAAEMRDMEPGGERRMLCVEAAAVDVPVALEVGRRWSAAQVLTAEPRAE